MTWLSFGERTYHPGSLRLDIRPVADVCGDVRALPFVSDAFAGVECWHVIEHLLPWEAEAAVAELARVTQPGGTVDIAVPDLQLCAKLLLTGDTGALDYIYSPRPDPALCHRFGYTPVTLAFLLRPHFEATFIPNRGEGWTDDYAIHVIGTPRKEVT